MKCVLIFLRGEVINGGFGLVLDGSEEAGQRARLMLNWDVSNGVSMCLCVSMFLSVLFFYIPICVFV